MLQAQFRLLIICRVFYFSNCWQRFAATRGLGLKMRVFSVKDKFLKYKTISKLSQIPKSRVPAVSSSIYFKEIVVSFMISTSLFGILIFKLTLFSNSDLGMYS